MNRQALYRLLTNSVFCIEKGIAQNYLSLIKQDNFFGNNDVFELKSIVYFNQETGGISKKIESRARYISIISITGVVMKEDGMCGEEGTSTKVSQIYNSENDPNCQGIIFMVNSGGGAVTGTELMAKAIKNCSLPTISVVDGYCCSAAYWIASQSDVILTNAKTNIIGSIGTMVSISKDEENEIVITATQSVDKIKDYTDAVEGNYETIRENMLDPITEVFINSVKEGRANVNEDVFTGKTYLSKKSIEVGLVDAYGDLEDAIKYIKSI